MLPAYDYCMKCSHAFNILDARGAISVAQRQNTIFRVRKLAKRCAEAYIAQREAMGFPLLPSDATKASPTTTSPTTTSSTTVGESPS